MIATYKKMIQLIDNNMVNSIYLLQGYENYYIDTIIKLIINKFINKKYLEFNYKYICANNNLDINDLILLIKEYPIISKYRVLIIDNIHTIKNLYKFESYLKSYTISNNIILIICCKNNIINPESDLFKISNQYGVVFTSNKLKNYQIEKWILNYCKLHKYKISLNQCKYLSDNLDNDLYVINKILDRLFLQKNDFIFNDEDFKIIFNNNSNNKKYSIFNLTDSIADKNNNVFKMINLVYINDIKCNFNTILNHIGILFYKILFYHQIKNNSIDYICKLLKIQYFYIYKYKIWAKNYSVDDIMKIFNHLKYYNKIEKNLNKISDSDLLKELLCIILN
ncbi:MAG: hypothetical protein IR527_01605 [Bacteroides sp.]|nr:MAG: hypothetical protein IR527_01605 [Bacteroides sp.]